MAWFKIHDGTSSDAKWPVIARRAGINVGMVVAVWLALLDHASQNEERGSLSGFDCETIDALYGFEDGVCQRVIDALCDKGLIEGMPDNLSIVKWDKRQGRKIAGDTADSVSSPSSGAERVRRYREKIKMQSVTHVTPCNGDVTHETLHETQCNADVTPVTLHETQCNADVTPVTLHETQCNADVTPCNALRIDKIREDKKKEEIKESFCAEPSLDASTPPPENPKIPEAVPAEDLVITLPLNTGPEFPVTRLMVREWSGLYPAVDVCQQLRNMRGWLLENRQKRKTRSGIGRFIVNWLAKEQNRGGASRASPAPVKTFEQLEAERVAKMKERARQYDEARERGEAV